MQDTAAVINFVKHFLHSQVVTLKIKFKYLLVPYNAYCINNYHIHMPCTCRCLKDSVPREF
jgi:hypothetical protein